jgi:peptidoglycan/LPS O-acetylase OafA/YrhL
VSVAHDGAGCGATLAPVRRGAAEAVGRERRDGHLPALDGLRGVAILLVLVYHTIAQFPLVGLWRPPVALARLGWMGVDIFFVLSGWLITRGLIAERGASGALRAFYLRRALRIWPLYVLVVAMQCAIAFGFPAVLPLEAEQFRRAVPWLLTHTTNIYFALPSTSYRNAFGIGAFWSLGIEEQFYLVWPLLVLWCAPTRLATLCFSLAGLSLAARMVALALGVPPVATYMLPMYHLDGLALGAGLAALVMHRAAWSRLVDAVAPLAARPLRVSILAVAVAAVVTLCDATAGPEAPASQTAGIALGSLLAAAIVVVVVGHGQSALAKILAARPLCAAGRVSYGLYLLHGPVFYLADALMERWWPARPFALQVTLATVASVGLAALSWHCWERPWLSLRPPLPRGANRGDLSGTPVDPAVAARQQIGRPRCAALAPGDLVD